MAESSAADEQETQETPEPEEFLNRAARRAKGKKHGKAEVATHSQPHGRAAVPGRRQFGNRRTGG
jgi:hypothetical protein